MDIEIAEDPDIKGWGAAKRGECGMSVGVVYDSHLKRPYVYWGSDVQAFLDHLNLADTLITFNGKDFDIPIVEALTGRQLEVPLHIDLLAEIVKVTRTRKGYGLGALGERMLGRPKVGNGKDALTYYANAKWSELVYYCSCDVDLTKDLATQIALQGYVTSPGGDEIKLEIPLIDLA